MSGFAWRLLWGLAFIGGLMVLCAIVLCLEGFPVSQTHATSGMLAGESAFILAWGALGAAIAGEP